MKFLKKIFLFALLVFLIQSYAFSQNRPNVLFLIIEDTSPYLFPAYGNEQISTPNIDFLAENGVVFDNAFANAPQCSPARSSLESGCPATVYGNDIHREKHYQSEQYFLMKKLKDAGYFTVNAGKSDYNITGSSTWDINKQAWDKSGQYFDYETIKANQSYNDSERNNKPFFGKFNNSSTHMSRMATITIDNRVECKIDANEVILPPHVPDLPEVRADYALHLEGVQDIDEWVGVFIADLQKRELLENTIIFFFSDHGGCLPRGKAFPYSTGHRVPLIVYAPEQYKDLLPANTNGRTDRLVSFDDFYPTVLSICGIESPNYVFGKPFMGEFAESSRDYIYMFRTNSGPHFDPSRSVFDGKYHYIRQYLPYKIHGLTQGYQWQMPAQLAWDEHFLAGNALQEHTPYYTPHKAEALFDLEADPYAMNNLADSPEYQQILEELRQQNSNWLRETKDLGFLAREDRKSMTEKEIIFYDWVRENNYPLDELYTLVEAVSFADESDLELFNQAIQSDKHTFRFWGVAGMAHLAFKGLLSTVPAGLETLLDDEKDIAATAAEALVHAGETSTGLNHLIDTYTSNTYAVSALEELCLILDPVPDEMNRIIDEQSGGFNRRSLLVKLGELSIDELYNQTNIDNQYETYIELVTYYLRTLPEYIPVTSIAVGSDAVDNNLEIGDSCNMHIDVLPVDAPIKTVVWSVDNSSLATVNERTGVLKALASGKVTVTATHTLTGVTGATTIVLGNTTGIKKPPFEQIMLYPNPAKEIITIGGLVKDIPVRYEVFDSLGRSLKFGTIGKNAQINISELNPGNYLLQLYNEQGNVASKKLVLKD